MGTVFTVTTSSLKTKAEELSKLNESFKKQVETLVTQESKLNSSWEGEANTAFHAAFNKDITQMNNFYNAIAQYVKSLGTIAAEYDKAEAANVNLATTRK